MNKNWVIQISFLMMIILLCGCFDIGDNGDKNNENSNGVHQYYNGVSALVDYGDKNISSYELNKILNNYNISTIDDNNYVVLYFNNYSNFYDNQYNTTGLKTNYRGHNNDSFQQNLTFHITYLTPTIIGENDPKLDQTFNEEKNIVENVVNKITEIMEKEWIYQPVSIEIEKIFASPDS